MSVAPISGINGIASVTGTQAAKPASGFGDIVAKAVEAASEAEKQADAIAQDIAIGGDSSVQDLMVAMTKAELGIDLLVQMRNKAVEAYQEIMRMQV